MPKDVINENLKFLQTIQNKKKLKVVLQFEYVSSALNEELKQAAKNGKLDSELSKKLKINLSKKLAGNTLAHSGGFFGSTVPLPVFTLSFPIQIFLPSVAAHTR